MNSKKWRAKTYGNDTNVKNLVNSGEWVRGKEWCMDFCHAWFYSIIMYT